MQPLFEHRLDVAGYDTRALELEGEALPDTRVELLDDVGHCPQLEATDRLLELLLPFPLAVPEATG